MSSRFFQKSALQKRVDDVHDHIGKMDSVIGDYHRLHGKVDDVYNYVRAMGDVLLDINLKISSLNT